MRLVNHSDGSRARSATTAAQHPAQHVQHRVAGTGGRLGLLSPRTAPEQGAEEVADTANVINNPYKLDPKLFLGPLGMPGLTAYSSFYDIGVPKKGETIFISSAAGPVGQLVGQLAKHEGLTVIGSVGEDKKLDFITKELGFDAGFNYKKEKPLDALKRLAPKGIDIYYENVGGEQLEAAITCMNDFGRIVACGTPRAVCDAADSRTAPYLRRLVPAGGS